MSVIASTKLGDFRHVVRDGKPIWLFRCPGCSEWGELDDDQWHGVVSVDHTPTGCTYHETHDFACDVEVQSAMYAALTTPEPGEPR